MVMVKNLRTIFALLLCSVIVFSCDPDDDTNPLDELIGTWDLTNISITGCNDPLNNSVDGQPIGCINEDGIQICAVAEITFDENGTFTQRSTATFTLLATGISQTVNQLDTSTFTINGNEITICSDGDCETATFSVVGTTLNINESRDTDGCTSSLSGTKRP